MPVPRTFVALDLETTGLDPNRDAIIEVGAVKFRDGEPVEEYHSLINPGRPLPFEISQLTGITDRDLIGKPAFDQVAGAVMRFVGQQSVVGHNVGFDLGFLRGQGLLAENLGLDTWELSTILLPSLPGYSLGALADRFGLAQGSKHRALDDARMTGRLFLYLCERAAHVPRAVLLEIIRLAQDSDWPLAEVFAAALPAAGFGRSAAQEAPLEKLAPDSPLFQPPRGFEPLSPVEDPTPVDVDELARMLRPHGRMAQAFPGYEYRPPQVQMLEAVAGAFNQGHHLMAEAGTGTGKSVAYLLPAIAYAIKNGTRVVVSTNTINLQDQLFKKDLPDLQRMLQDWRGAGQNPAEPAFRAALLKGRSNYLCPRRFAGLKARANLNRDELRGVARILVWLPQTQTGDQGELSLPLPSDQLVWSQVSAENEGCTLERCYRDMNGRCFFYRARKQAEAAHIVVVNHALLLADAATANRVLPQYQRLIVDEAHHLEDAVTDQLSFKADSGLLTQLFAALYPAGGGAAAASAGRRRTGRQPQAASGLLAEILAGLRAHIPPELSTVLRDQIVRSQGEVEAVHTRLGLFWEVINDAVQTLQPGGENSEYDQRIRVTAATRSQPVWVEIEVAWESLALAWDVLAKRLAALHEGLGDVRQGGFDAPGLESMTEDLGNALGRLAELYTRLEAWVMKPDSNSVYWIEIGGVNSRMRRVTLRAAPLHVGPLVQEHILFHNETVILTSATLRTAGSFDYLRDRLQAHEADTVTVGSPFDYKASTLLYLPTDLPEPNAPGFQTAVDRR